MRSLKEAELIAVCDVIKERALQCADQYGVLCYENYEELLKHEYIDVVCLCKPSGMHPNQTVMAA
jgi:predicted dehydrogenase